jgi:hypothetical protein
MGELGYSSSILHLGNRWRQNGQLHAPCRITPKERAPSTLWAGECTGHRAGLGRCEVDTFNRGLLRVTIQITREMYRIYK